MSFPHASWGLAEAPVTNDSDLAEHTRWLAARSSQAGQMREAGEAEDSDLGSAEEPTVRRNMTGKRTVTLDKQGKLDQLVAASLVLLSAQPADQPAKGTWVCGFHCLPGNSTEPATSESFQLPRWVPQLKPLLPTASKANWVSGAK